MVAVTMSYGQGINGLIVNEASIFEAEEELNYLKKEKYMNTDFSKRYWLFYGEYHESMGGLDDYYGSYDCITAALLKFGEFISIYKHRETVEQKIKYNWLQVFDSENKVVIFTEKDYLNALK